MKVKELIEILSKVDCNLKQIEKDECEYYNAIHYLMDMQNITEFTMPLDQYKDMTKEPLILEVDYECNKITIRKVNKCQELIGLKYHMK